MLTSEQNDHLLRLLVFHYYYTVLKVKVHKNVLWGFKLKGLESLFLHLFAFDVLEEV